MHILCKDIGRCKHVTMVDNVIRLCGHYYEYGTTDINFLKCICIVSRIIST